MRSNVDKYFEGYEKVAVQKKNGKGMTTRYEYRGTYFHIKKTGAEMKKIKLLFSAFYLLYIVLYFYTSFLDTDASHTRYVGLISLVILIPGIYWLGGLWNFLTAKEYMEQRKYVFGLKRICASTKVMFYLSAAQIVGELLFLIIRHQEVNSYAMELKFIVFAGLESLVLFVFLQQQKKLEVEEVPNTVGKKEQKKESQI